MYSLNADYSSSALLIGGSPRRWKCAMALVVILAWRMLNVLSLCLRVNFGDFLSSTYRQTWTRVVILNTDFEEDSPDFRESFPRTVAPYQFQPYFEDADDNDDEETNVGIADAAVVWIYQIFISGWLHSPGKIETKSFTNQTFMIALLKFIIAVPECVRSMFPPYIIEAVRFKWFLNIVVQNQ